MNNKTIILTTIFSIITITALISLTGCIEEETSLVPDYLPTLLNDLENGQLTITNNIENITFQTKYSTPYNTSAWRITDSKTLTMELFLQSAPHNTTIFVEHVHCDINLKAKYAGVDGMLQDTMDDKLHSGNQPGFWISENHSYKNIFAIEGYSQTIIDGWGWMVGSYGAMNIRSERLTEKNLMNEGGVYGSKIQIVYDILIKYDNEPYYHTTSFVDEFLIPTKEQPKDTE